MAGGFRAKGQPIAGGASTFERRLDEAVATASKASLSTSPSRTQVVEVVDGADPGPRAARKRALARLGKSDTKTRDVSSSGSRSNRLLDRLSDRKRARRRRLAKPASDSSPTASFADVYAMTDPPFSRRFAIGLNTVPAGWYDQTYDTDPEQDDDLTDLVTVKKFGTDDGILDDCTRLGATVLRHVGKYDLTWENLAARVDPEKPVGVPLASEVIAEVNTADNQAKWGAFFEALYDRGLQVVLTCVAFGARDTDEDDTWTDSVDDKGIAEPLTLYWKPGTHMESVDDRWITDDRPAPNRLDISNDYEVTVLETMVEGIGLLLNDIASQIGAEKVNAVLYGLELFDEVDAMNVRVEKNDRYGPDNPDAEPWKKKVGDAPTHAADWANCWYTLAKRLRDTLDSSLDVPIFLPGISSWYEWKTESGETSRNSLDYRMSFLEFFLHYVSIKIAVDEYDPASLAGGLHWHWDHRSATKTDDDGTVKAGAQHIAHMVGEVEDVRTLRDDHGFEEAKLVLLRSGISVIDVDEQIGTFADGDAEWFQGYEVWRRLAGAMAAGADAIGWQSWMSFLGKVESGKHEWYGMGLRDDERNLADAKGRHARPRPAWYAYQRFVELLGNAVSARIVTPASTSAINGSDGALVIFEFSFSTSSTYRYAYLVLLDVVFAGECPSYELSVDADGLSSSRPVARAYETFPTSTVVEASVTFLPDGTSTLSPDVWGASGTWADAESFDVPKTMDWSVEDPPLVVKSSQRLAWTVSYECTRTRIDWGPGDPPGSRLPRIARPGQDKDTYTESTTVYVDGVKVSG